MKVVLAGAFGHLGAQILKCLCAQGHEVVAADARSAAYVDGLLTNGGPPPTLSKRRWARTLPPSCSEKFCLEREEHKKIHKSRF